MRYLLCSRLALETQQQTRPTLYDIRGEKGFGLESCAPEVLALLLLVQTLNHLISQSLLFSHL